MTPSLFAWTRCCRWMEAMTLVWRHCNDVYLDPTHQANTRLQSLKWRKWGLWNSLGKYSGDCMDPEIAWSLGLSLTVPADAEQSTMYARGACRIHYSSQVVLTGRILHQLFISNKHSCLEALHTLNAYQAPVPLTVFRSNSKLGKIYSLKCAQPITTKFCTRHDSNTVVECAKFGCGQTNM